MKRKASPPSLLSAAAPKTSGALEVPSQLHTRRRTGFACPFCATRNRPPLPAHASRRPVICKCDLLGRNSTAYVPVTAAVSPHKVLLGWYHNSQPRRRVSERVFVRVDRKSTGNGSVDVRWSIFHLGADATASGFGLVFPLLRLQAVAPGNRPRPNGDTQVFLSVGSQTRKPLPQRSDEGYGLPSSREKGGLAGGFQGHRSLGRQPGLST